MIGRFFGFGRKSAEGEAVDPATSYETDKEIAHSGDDGARRRLAGRENVKPEILYFLAADATPEVRRAIATNIATPPHANLLLTKDVDEETRVELAKKIGRLLPDLPDDESSRVRDITCQVIEVLARDQLPRIRAILAEEIKSSPKAPRDVVRLLANDLSSIVSTPILEYSPLLSDDDLLEIIATGTAAERLSAIARRRTVSGDVSDAIVATLDAPAVANLLANPSAQIREETLDTIISHASSIENWHKPLVMRAELSLRAMRRISGFVATALIEQLAARHDLDDTFRKELRAQVTQRLGDQPVANEQPGAYRARQLFETGKLDDEVLAEAIDRPDREFVLHALSLKTGLALPLVQRIVQSRQPKAVTALAWKGNFSMRSAMRLQLRIAAIPPKQILNAKNGVDYPLAGPEFEEQLKLFGA